jgi:hypothetical protein
MLSSLLSVAAATGGGCTSTSSATDLTPQGPPMVRQVFMTETITDASVNPPVIRSANSIAFGDHPDFEDSDDRVVTAAVAGNTNHVRVVVDELLIGNYLEQISCRDGSYQSVPEGTTPDDIALCSVASDLLATNCKGPHAVCLDSTGVPIGVQDEVPTGGDGAADDSQFIAGIVHIDCSGIDVPLDIANTFWQPAGNQQVPAAGGFNSVGPAIVIVTTQGFPTNSECTIDFDDSIIDKDRIPVCAPPKGGFVDGEIDPSVACPGAEADGDTSLITWGTEPLRVPNNSTFPANGATNVPLTASGSPDARITVKYNAELSRADAAGFTLLEGGTVRAITVALDPGDEKSATVTVPGGYIAGTTYMLIIGEGSAFDVFDVPMPDSQETTITFSTAAP